MKHLIGLLSCSFLLLLLSNTQSVYAQGDAYRISDIRIKGNKRTKEKVILREIDFAVGDTLYTKDSKERLTRNEQLVMNTSLFTAVNIQLDTLASNKLKVLIEVREFWYIFPLALFKLADRNFSIWWTEQNRSLERVNYGMRFFHHNLTGRRDRLRVITQLGYLKVLEVAYDLPMVGNNENLGIFADIHFSNQKEVAYVTADSRLQFYKEPEEPILLKRFRVGAGATYRDGLYQYHTGKLFYSSSWIGASIASLNPDYFLNGLEAQQHFTLQYDFTIDRRDVKVYPIKGDHLTLFAQKDGFGLSHEDVNVLSTTVAYSRFFALGKQEKHTFGAKLKARYTFNRSEQPYTHISAIGYQPDVFKGYEFYVIDGMDYLYLKTHFRFRLLQKEINWGKWVFLQQFRFMPIKVFFTINNDVGFVNAPYNQVKSTLSNQILWGRGLGLDILLYYDKLLRFEYSFNHLGERGLFFSWELAF